VRIVVVGATGNVGTSVLGALADEPAVDTVLGIARCGAARVGKDHSRARAVWIAVAACRVDVSTRPITPTLRLQRLTKEACR
jgi:dihydrodipicolinate reductase